MLMLGLLGSDIVNKMFWSEVNLFEYLIILMVGVVVDDGSLSLEFIRDMDDIYIHVSHVTVDSEF